MHARVALKRISNHFFIKSTIKSIEINFLQTSVKGIRSIVSFSARKDNVT